MSRMVSRTALRDLVRRRSDTVDDLDRFPDTVLNEEINVSLANYHSKLVALRGADYFEKQWFVMPAFTKSNPASPTITVSGVPTFQFTLVLTVTVGGLAGTATLTWAAGGLTGVVTTSASSALIELPGTGLSIVNPSGTYTVSNTYTSIAASFRTTANQSMYVLPVDFMQTSMIEVDFDGYHLPVEKFNKNQRPWLRDARTWLGIDSSPMYRLRGDGRYKDTQFIEFAPVPAGVYEVVMWYIPQPAVYTADSVATAGTWELPFDCGGEEWVACDVAEKLMLQDNIDPSFLLARKAAVEQAIVQTFSSRDAAMPERVVDRNEASGPYWWVRRG